MDTSFSVQEYLNHMLQKDRIPDVMSYFTTD